MSLLKKLQEADHKMDAVLMHPTAPAYPNADRLEITYPGDDAVWIPGEFIDVSWDLKGDVSSPLNVALVRATGEAFGELSYFTLVEGVEPEKGRATVEIPDVPPGDRYAISISNDDPLTVYSESITITEPA
jgi:hypothetical protein